MEPEAIPITKKFLRLFFVYSGAVSAPLASGLTQTVTQTRKNQVE